MGTRREYHRDINVNDFIDTDDDAKIKWDAKPEISKLKTGTLGLSSFQMRISCEHLFTVRSYEITPLLSTE